MRWLCAPPLILLTCCTAAIANLFCHGPDLYSAFGHHSLFDPGSPASAVFALAGVVAADHYGTPSPDLRFQIFDFRLKSSDLFLVVQSEI
jgi:hypothetical protein